MSRHPDDPLACEQAHWPIRACRLILTDLSEIGQHEGNHAKLLMLLPPVEDQSGSSFNFEMIVLDEDPPGVFEGKYRPFYRQKDFTNHDVKTLDLAMHRSVTPINIHNMILNAGLDKYRFDFEGYGCKFWTVILMDLLEHHGILQPESTVAALRVLAKMYSFVQGGEEQEIAIGSFEDVHFQVRALTCWKSLADTIALKL